MVAKNIHYLASARSHVGQVREHNQDNVWLLSENGFVCGVVADGIGDGTEGVEASQIVIQCIKTLFQDQQALENLNDETWAQLLTEALNTANQHIIEYLPKAGSTVTTICVHDLRATIAHVGEGRAYLVDASKNQGIQLTTDHTFMERLIVLDDWRPQDPTPKLVLYRALGQTETIEIDSLNINLQIGDRLLLCTDGLYRHVSDDEMAVITLAEKNPDDATQKLIDLANERGGEDNISVVVIAVEADL